MKAVKRLKKRKYAKSVSTLKLLAKFMITLEEFHNCHEIVAFQNSNRNGVELNFREIK
jgi:hypothetical protein